MKTKIEKIKNYNQVILAIGFTICLIFLIFFGVIGIIDYLPIYSEDNSNKGILAIDETDELLQDSLRKQIISFSRIQVIDSINQTYVLPVTQADLAEAENTSDILGLLNTKSIGRSYKVYEANIYNNLILYSSIENKTKIIFNDRISFKNYLLHNTLDEKYIVIPGCSVDSNNDKYLNSKDLQELFIYDVQKGKLNKIIAKENYTTIRVYQPKLSNDLIVHFGIDRNKNGIFERLSEPMIFYKIDLTTMTLKEFVNKEQMMKLQKQLEGQKSGI